mmetsp:Transcript_26680/g.58654  ORF Transcript_26680/g.58654 Transcript_26680/m.58654 type:complete len:202 (+) Transcript_26680:1269-1874(+)
MSGFMLQPSQMTPMCTSTSPPSSLESEAGISATALAALFWNSERSSQASEGESLETTAMISGNTAGRQSAFNDPSLKATSVLMMGKKYSTFWLASIMASAVLASTGTTRRRSLPLAREFSPWKARSLSCSDVIPKTVAAGSDAGEAATRVGGSKHCVGSGSRIARTSNLPTSWPQLACVRNCKLSSNVSLLKVHQSPSSSL